jgi:hypothetical protein
MPDDLIVTRYADGENVSLGATSSEQEATVVASGFVDDRISVLQLRTGNYSQEDSARRLAWEAGSLPTLTYHLSEAPTLSPLGALAFDLASGSDQYRPRGIQVTVTDENGATATVAADLITGFRPPLRTDLLKWRGMPGVNDLEWAWQTERIPQTYEIPLGAFVDVNSNLDLGSVVQIRIEFDGSAAGSVLIDEVGLRR